jgi:hypothetical protein
MAVAIALLTCSPVYGQEKPDFNGRWKLQTDRPRYSEIWTVTQTPRDIRIRMEIVDEKLGDRVMNYAAALDGKEHKQTIIGTAASVTAGWEGDALRLEIKRQARPDLLLHNRRLMRLSADKKRIETKMMQHSPPPPEERAEVFERLVR